MPQSDTRVARNVASGADVVRIGDCALPQISALFEQARLSTKQSAQQRQRISSQRWQQSIRCVGAHAAPPTSPRPE
ncbi:hypothetical protein GGR70_003427 [Xanthomonas campestris]|nr:hypothetical protein [Xanthomonas campestris]